MTETSLPINIGDRGIGPGLPCFIIAEAGVNHNGDIELAAELIRQAKAAGADCVKFQTFKADEVAVEAAPKAEYQRETTDPAQSQLDMLRDLVLPESAYPYLMRLCQEVGITFLSSPGNEKDADFLDELGVCAFKTASFQIVEPRFLTHLASKRKPMFISTGMANAEEVGEAICAVRGAGNSQLVLLQCTTNYPSSSSDANIRAMARMAEEFQCIVGYSDHTVSPSACLAAVAMGAKIIEKHFTLDKNLPGPDHRASANPEELKTLVAQIRELESTLGDGEKRPCDIELRNVAAMRRSIVAAGEIKRGALICDADLILKRPGTGIKPACWANVVGRRAKKNIPRNSLLCWDDLD